MNLSRRKITIDYYYILYFFIVLPFLYPAYFTESGSLEVFELIITYLSIGLMVFEIIRDKQRQISYFPFFVLLIDYIILLYSTYTNQGELITTFNTTIKKLLLCFLIGKIINNERKSMNLMRTVRDICVVIFFVNLLSEIFFPTGIPSTTTSIYTPHYFLGNVNSVIRAVFPGICCSILINEKENKKVSLSIVFFYAGLLYQFVFLYHSATTIVAMIIIMAWIVFSGVIKRHIRSIYVVVIGVIAYIQINLVVMSASPKLLHFLSSLFGKSITFSGRIYIWERALIQIYRRPVFGYGIQKSEVLNAIIGNQFSAHNYFLDIAYQRGIVGLIVFLILIVLPLFLLHNSAHNISSMSYYLVGFQSSIMFMYLFEPFYSSEARMLPILYCMVLLLIKENRGSRKLRGGNKALTNHG